MPGRPLRRHVLDSDPRYAELLRQLRAAGGYAYLQQLVDLWPQGRASAYRAVQRLVECGALRLREMAPRSVAILTRPAARYLGLADRDRSDPSYHQLMTGVYRLAWFQREGRHLTLDLPERPAADVGQLEGAREGARQLVEQVVQAIRDAETERGRLEQERTAAAGRVFGGKAEAQRLAELVALKTQEIAELTRRHQEAQGALQRAQKAVMDAKLVGAQPAPAAWRRQMQARAIFLDPGGPGLTLVAVDLDRSRTWLRDSLRLCGHIAKSYGGAWRLLLLTCDDRRAAGLEAMARSILAAVPGAVGRYRRVAGEKAKEQAAKGIIEPLPVEVRAVDMGVAEYLRAPGGRRRDVRELLSVEERTAIAGLKGGSVSSRS